MKGRLIECCVVFGDLVPGSDLHDGPLRLETGERTSARRAVRFPRRPCRSEARSRHGYCERERFGYSWGASIEHGRQPIMRMSRLFGRTLRQAGPKRSARATLPPPGARAGRRAHARAGDYRPILEALEEMGGSGRADDVLRRVYDKVVARLNPVDLQPLPLAREPRWRKTARWARWAMVKEGLLRRDSSRGVWEISDAGREWLRGEQSRD